ncbi:MAG: sirohydrochlorin cobaltochelatase, partial [Desulfovibrio sp.]|nr:sirohydrochlorin cobaltochelatase [Desulfovibrio sp.]
MYVASCSFSSFFPSFLSFLLLACHSPKGTSDYEPKEGILLVAFGTSVPEALPAMKAVDAAFKAAFPGEPVVWAYTSQIIRKKIAAEGRPVGGIADGLASLAAQGVSCVRVQSLHVMAGEEFSALERALLLDVKKHPGRFEHVYLGRPMLESREDAVFVAKAVIKDSKPLRKKGEALVLMGHGQEHGRCGLTFEGARAVFHEIDRSVFMATG